MRIVKEAIYTSIFGDSVYTESGGKGKPDENKYVINSNGNSINTLNKTQNDTGYSQ